jgi:hypothetical protein
VREIAATPAFDQRPYHESVTRARLADPVRHFWNAITRHLRATRPRWIVFLAWSITIFYAYPGYLNWDSGDQIFLSRTNVYEDWHPPIMAVYWHAIEWVIRGPFGMLVLQTSLFAWGIYSLLALRFRPHTAALVTAGILLLPPILTPMAAVWKDAQMAGFLVAGFALALRTSWRSRIAGLVLLVLAAAVRDNGAAALPPLCIAIVSGWAVRKRFITLRAAVLCVLIVVVAMGANKLVVTKRVHAWYRTVAIHDIVGTICVEDRMSDDEVRTLLAGVPLVAKSDIQRHMCKHYNPRIWFPIVFADDPVFNLFPDKAERLARGAAWKHMVRTHPHAYLSHRWLVMKEVLGLSESQPWEPVCQSFAANADHLQRIRHDASLSPLQETLGTWFRTSWSTKLWYRPWVYALLSAVLLAYAIRRRDTLLFALLGSGLLYEASLFIGAAAPDFRYSHWMVTTTILAMAIIFGERLRAGIEARRSQASAADGVRRRGTFA